MPIPATTSTRRRSPASWRSEQSSSLKGSEAMDQVATTVGSKPKTLIEIDLTESPYKNDMIHNRWHPDIPIVAWVKPGDDFVIQTYDWTGGFIQNNESADDV